MTKMKERIKQFFYLFLAIAIAFLAWGLLKLNQAALYRPQLPEQAALKQYSFDRKEQVFPLTRYENLLSGALFFGELPPPPPPPPPPKVEFKSQLIVIGVTKGASTQDGYAVVGLQKTGEEETWIVNAGSVIAGERILSIHNGYILVRNQTGTGKVRLRD
ncbi:MAG: hypothetical protein PVH64_00260 [Bacillota bacterium]